MPRRIGTKSATSTRRTAATTKAAQNYIHTDSTSPMRPEVVTQTRFKKKLPPAKFRYDDSLAPSMEWDGQNPARDKGEWLLGLIEEAFRPARATQDLWCRKSQWVTGDWLRGRLPSVYGHSSEQMKYRQLYVPSEDGRAFDQTFTWVDENGVKRPMTKQERSGEEPLIDRQFARADLSAQNDNQMYPYRRLYT